MSINELKYRFSDFTIENYRKLIQLAKKNFVFRGFHNFSKNERFILWRHDVDSSPQIALKLALIEKEEGVKATYFINLHSEFYNFWERPIYDCFNEISKLGHDIGVHFDCNFYGKKVAKNFEQLLLKEKQFLENELDVKILSFSFHNPTNEILKMDKFKYSGLINAYSADLKNTLDYCSDSNGFWKFDRLEDVLTKKNNKSLHVLTHAGWWQDKVLPPRQKIMRLIDTRANYYKNLYDNFLKKGGRENIDWDN